MLHCWIRASRGLNTDVVLNILFQLNFKDMRLKKSIGDINILLYSYAIAL